MPSNGLTRAQNGFMTLGSRGYMRSEDWAMRETSDTGESYAEITISTPSGEVIGKIRSDVQNSIIQSVQFTIDEQGCADFKIKLNALPPFPMFPFSIATIKIGNTRFNWYAGEISYKDDEKADDEPYEYAGVGLRNYLKTLRAQTIYSTGTDVGAVVADLIQTWLVPYSPIQYNASKVKAVTGVILANDIELSSAPLETIMNTLASMAACDWGVDGDKDLYFWPKTTDVKRTLFVGYSVNTFKPKWNLSEVKNAIIVQRQEGAGSGGVGWSVAGVYNDASSVKKYGRKEMTFQVPGFFSDEECDIIGNALLAEKKEPDLSAQITGFLIRGGNEFLSRGNYRFVMPFDRYYHVYDDVDSVDDWAVSGPGDLALSKDTTVYMYGDGCVKMEYTWNGGDLAALTKIFKLGKIIKVNLYVRASKTGTFLSVGMGLGAWNDNTVDIPIPAQDKFINFEWDTSALDISSIDTFGAKLRDVAVKWMAQTSAFGTTKINKIIYTGAYWLAVGASGKIAKSIDGITWSLKTSGTACDLYDVSYMDGLLVTVGDRAAQFVFSDDDGETWTPGTAGSGKYIVVGTSGSLWSSTDNGINWSAETTGIGNNLFDVAYFGGLFVAVGASGKIITSSGNGNWEEQSSGISDVIISIMHDGEKFIAAVGANKPLYSSDGITWKAGGSTGGQWVEEIAHNGSGVWVAVTSGTTEIYRSTDGINWTAYPSIVSVALLGICYGGGLFVAVGNNGTIITSPDGINWTSRTSGVSWNILDVEFGAGKFIAVGADANSLQSTDAETWAPVSIGATGNLIRYNRGIWVHTRNTGQIRYSTDNGANWSVATTPAAYPNLYGSCFGLTGRNNTVDNDGATFAAGGNSGKLYTSTDGETWAERTSQFSTDDIYGVCDAGDKLVAVGEGAKISTSADGTTWAARTAPSGVTADLRAVCYSGSLVVAVGDGATIITSEDGVSWEAAIAPTGVTDDLFDVMYHNGLFVAVGDNGLILTSPNGADWLQQDSETTEALNGIEATSSRIIAVGDAGTQVYSDMLAELTASTDIWIDRIQFTVKGNKHYTLRLKKATYKFGPNEQAASAEFGVLPPKMENYLAGLFATANELKFTTEILTSETGV